LSSINMNNKCIAGDVNCTLEESRKTK